MRYLRTFLEVPVLNIPLRQNPENPSNPKGLAIIRIIQILV